jgi:hypothetical protein
MPTKTKTKTKIDIAALNEVADILSYCLGLSDDEFMDLVNVNYIEWSREREAA